MKKNNKKGFTLVELVIVVAVMAILVAIAIPTIGSITTKATDAVNKTNCETIESMIKLEAAKKQAKDDGTVEISATDVKTALENAKLGIDDGTFYYDTVTGAVTTAKHASNKSITITYASGVVTTAD